MTFSLINEFIIAILIGLIQGITEFLPISSTAHLDLLGRIFLNGKDFGLSTSNIIQLGTTLALLIYFQKDLKPIFHQLVKIFNDPKQRTDWWSDTKSWWSRPSKSLFHTIDQNKTQYSGNFKTNILISQLILVTIPIALLGALLQKYVDFNLRGLGSVAVFLSIGAGLLMFAEFLNQKFSDQNDNSKNISNDDDMTILSRDQVITIGIFQSLAIFPGMSRSGSTIAGSLLVGLNRPKSARFAFLAGIPALIISSLKDIIEIFTKSFKELHFLPTEKYWNLPNNRIELSLTVILVATIVAFLVGFTCLRWLILYLSKRDTRIFSYYRFALSVVIVLVILILNIIGR